MGEVGDKERMVHACMTFTFGDHTLPTGAFDCSFGRRKSISARDCASRLVLAMTTRRRWIQVSFESFDFVGLPRIRE